LTERLGGSVIGASIWDVRAGKKSGPYHFHHGVEEWHYVVSGAPVLHTGDGERALEPGELLAFPSGPAGAHTLHGPGRVVIFSAGDRGWCEAFVSVYPDSDKIGAAPGVKFRRADAIGTCLIDTRERMGGRGCSAGPASRAMNLMMVSLVSSADETSCEGDSARKATTLGRSLGAENWTATLYELAPGEATTAYCYEWCREEWALVLSGAPVLRHADGQTVLSAGDICCSPITSDFCSEKTTGSRTTGTERPALEPGHRAQRWP
jgi:uncharacterized cupin superfamily protein